ncbi:hypothetical protein L0Z42_24045 [Burkholderia multivorans]|uniref:hypothetical protein n=1 Tax=Burkholderia multivorans TaxID=87883 RepID=UPI001C231B5A|nr:hypothetical protein [Burkholderia multivorans]MBU9691137.1 hypothetical protein [Burkholderia multivorans]MCO1373578.1 hypothetical protein [Burkholderia multivorans]MCO1455165.1 hypothetical protein [Burkholderia multivorans]MCO1469718.1 hypothetical protein [Burkholderia multivorans]UQO20621.1 hypothetical protein L0Z02_21400 [Burkholderia multivorans]
MPHLTGIRSHLFTRRNPEFFLLIQPRFGNAMLQRRFVRREAITGDSFVSYPDNETGFVAFGKTGIRH